MMTQHAQFLTPRCKSPLIIAIQLQATFSPEPLPCCHFSFYKSIIFTSFAFFLRRYTIIITFKVKPAPWHAWAGKEETRSYSFNRFPATSRRWVIATCPGCVTLKKEPMLIVQEAGWTCVHHLRVLIKFTSYITSNRFALSCNWF